MQNQQLGVPSKALGCCWSNRILLLATAGILFLTLYPFRLEFHASPPGSASPLFLRGGLKAAGLFDAFLNVLLFVPFGFGLAEKFRERGKSLAFTIALALASGAVFSYCIELLQFYIPQRDSGWEDVFTNTSGSVVGLVLYEILGKFLLRGLSHCESLLEGLLTPRRAYVILLIYFAVCCGASARLQRNTRLSNWRPDVLLVLGNDASGKFPWQGTINAVQLWDLALRKEAAQQLSAGQPVDTGNPGLLLDYDFSAGPPFRNQRQVSSELAWVPRAPATAGSGLLVLDGASWLTSPVAVSDLVANFEKTNQFTVHVLCTPAQGGGSEGRIISISQPSGFADLALRQEDANLAFWFRNPLSANRAILSAYSPGVFTPGRTRDIIYTYDGANLSLFLEGKQQLLNYRLGPGTALAKSLRTVRSAELDGYNFIYYALIFCLPGALLGIAARNLARSRAVTFFWLAGGSLIPAIVMEWTLVSTSGRSFSSDYLALPVVLALASVLWINSDRWASLRRENSRASLE
jgi:hypothetical protein